MPLSLIRKQMTKPEHISAIGWMLFSAFCFAVMGAFTHALSGRFDWSVIAFSRAFVNLIFIAVLALVTSKPLIFFSAPANLWWRSVFGTFSLFGTFYVFSYVPIAEATSVVNTVPLWMVIMLAFISKQHVPRSVWFAVFCGIAGVCFIQQPHFSQTNFAIAIGLAGAFFAAVAMYNLHQIANVHPVTIVAHFMSTASILTFLVMVPSLVTIFEGERYSLAVILALLGVGVSGTVAQLAMTHAYMLGNPATNSTVGLGQVAFATLFDVVVWHRSFTPATIFGIALITIPTTYFLAKMPVRNSIPST